MRQEKRRSAWFPVEDASESRGVHRDWQRSNADCIATHGLGSEDGETVAQWCAYTSALRQKEEGQLKAGRKANGVWRYVTFPRNEEPESSQRVPFFYFSLARILLPKSNPSYAHFPRSVFPHLSLASYGPQAFSRAEAGAGARET